MTSYEERMAAMGGSDSDSDYLEMKKYVKPKPSATSVKKKKKKANASKAAAKTAVARKGSSGSPANKRKRTSTYTIKEESDTIHSEDYGLSDLFATPSYMPEHTAHSMHSSYLGHDRPVTNTLHAQDTFVQDQDLEAAYSNSAFSYNPAFGANLVDGFATEYFPHVNGPGASYSYSNEAGRSVFDDDYNGIDGETQQINNPVSPSLNESSRYEGSESEDERPRKAAKLNKDGEPRKPRRPRPKLLKWSDDDWKNVILGIVWACGETGVQIPFEQAAQVVGEHCTAGALQQALLKLRGKQIAEGYQIPSLKMAWTRKNKHASSSSSSSANSKSAQVHDAGKNSFPRKQPTRVAGTQSKLVTLRRSYSDLDRQGILFPFKWKKPSQSTERGVSWNPTDTKQDDTIGHPRPLSVSDIQDIPESGSGAGLPTNAQMSYPNNPYAHTHTHAIQIQLSGQSIQGRRQQNHRNGKVTFGSGDLTLNPAGSVDGLTATFHNSPDTEGMFVMDPLSDDSAVTPKNSSTLQHSEETLGMLEGRGHADGLSELRTDFVFPERPSDLGQSSGGITRSPRIVSTPNNAACRQGHRRSTAIVPGSLFAAGMTNNVDHVNVNRTNNDTRGETITYNDIVANTTLIHAPNTPNRFAQVYNPGYLDSANSWFHRSPSTPDNTVAAKGHVSFALTSSTRSNGAFNPQGNHTVDLNGDMTMARASYETLLTANDTEGFFNGFADLADDIFD